jgi:FkbM family methyltransferase
MASLVQYLGLARSLALYYADPDHVHRAARFYGRFIRPGDLCFDVGAHVGSRIAAWTRLGARTVAVEPVPHCARLLRLLYGRRRDVELVEAALGPAEGRAELLVDDREPTVSTVSTAWAARMRRERPGFAGVRWNRSVTVEVTTLDAVVALYGEPSFCKIDVEGYDIEVLRGLSRPLRALSFECVPPAADLALACMDRLLALGSYEFNFSYGESMRLHRATWGSRDDLGPLLRSLPADGPCGDVYARLRGLT